MNLFKKIKEWYITKKTGLDTEQRRVRQWYQDRINYRGTLLREIYYGFDYLIEVDPWKVLDGDFPLGWVASRDFKMYQYPNLPIDEAASWVWIRGFKTEEGLVNNEIGGTDYLYAVTNSKETAIKMITKFTGVTNRACESAFEELADKLKREVDWTVMSGMVEEQLGWTRIVLERNRPTKEWLEENIKSPYYANSALNQFVIQDSKDAVLLALTWT